MSINARGITDTVKRRAIFSEYRNLSEILIVQETHSTPEIENIWQSEWGGKIIFCHGTSSARGIAIFVKKGFMSNISNIYVHEGGRLIICDVNENREKISVFAVYSPNDNNSTFFGVINKLMVNRQANKLLIGDFNCTLDVNLDRKNTYCNNNKVRDEILNIMDQYLLVDVWRLHNGNKLEYSWFKSGQIQKASRIDFALISKGIDHSKKHNVYKRYQNRPQGILYGT